MILHPIDRPDGEYTEEELDRFMVFLLLDRANLYATVCKCFDILAGMKMVTRRQILGTQQADIEAALRAGGHRFPRQTAKAIKDFGYNQINLKTATREELVKGINGIGHKLASMFVRNTRKERVAVIDVHIKRFLQSQGWEIEKMSYYAMEQAFMGIADNLGVDPTSLDLIVWEAYRRKNHDGEKV